MLTLMEASRLLRPGARLLRAGFLPTGYLRTGRVACAVAVLAAFSALGGNTAWGQASANPEIRGLLERMDRLQRDLNTLQRQVYRGGPPPAAGVAPGLPDGGASPTFAADMQVRLDEIENQMRALTGRLEEANHAIAELGRKLELMTSDMELRFKQLESRAPGTPGGGQGPGTPPPAAGAPSQPGVLGTLPSDDAGPKGATGGEQESQTAALPKGTPEEQYRHATGLLAKSDWPGAERALAAFIDAHPKHELAGNAQYWLGETYYVRGDYNNAALAFAKGYKDYPKSGKGPDNLLKLGLALGNLNKTQSACATFERFGKDFPNAPSALKSRVAAERKKLRCK